MQMYPSGGYKEEYYTVVEEVDYMMKDDHHYNKGSSMHMMVKPTTANPSYVNNQMHGYGDHSMQHAHQPYGEHDDRNTKHGYGGYGGTDQNKHGYGGYTYGGAHDYNNNNNHHNQNKHGGEGYSAARYSETWYEKDRRNENNDWNNMKNNQQHGFGNHDQHNYNAGLMNGGYRANQGPHVAARRPVWESKGIVD
ncbi:hypothetical protein ACP275_05G020600 [Erythranthe tilingii]